MNNTASYGGGANAEIFTAVFDSHITFEDCNFIKNGITGDLVLNNDYVTAGSGLLFITDILQPTFNRSVDIVPETEHVPCTLSISGTNFTENRGFSGGAILIISLYAPLLGGTLQEELHISSCRFVSNFGVLGAAVFAQEWKQSTLQRGLDIIFHNVTFDNNTVYSLSDHTTSIKTSAVIELITLNVTFSGDSVIANSTGTGLQATSSVLIVMDNLTFYNNSGSYGGALRLETGTLMVLRNNTNVNFSKNTGAVYGGAIYSSTVASLPSISQVDCSIFFGHLNLLCFSTVHSDCDDITEYNTNVIFEGNTAPLGSMIYGTTLETCPWALELKNKYEFQNSNLSLLELLANESRWDESSFSSPFVFDKPPNNATQVSTGTARIVVNQAEISAIPGETITIGIQTLDKFNRSVPTVLTSQPSSDARKEHVYTLVGGGNYFLLQQSNDPGNLTMEANITVYGDEDVDSLSVSLFSLVSFSQSEITINVTSCLDGFTYDNNSHSCECSDLINAQNSRIECGHHDFTLHVSQDRWVGLGPNDELIVADCHFDYCLGGTRIIKPPDFDKQCQEGYNRSGIVCGKCADGYSTVFGSNRCLKCSNEYISMIILFALLGIALVSAISFLQITISEGYLNGMLFYANVLNLYLPLLTKSGSNIVHIFFLVSLLNLNLGFESCFYDGMNGLARTGLNLVFPFYIFSLMFIIILLLKWSNRFSNWFTRNGFSATKVFVTLLVMSYSSLLETCIEILGVDTISESNHTHIQWRIDNNQRYFHGSHAFLGLVAIILIIFLLPIPFLLLFEGRIFKFRIFYRYKPLYDAVWAPFKPKFRFWVGLRLILRGLPFIFVNVMPHPLNILFLATFLVALLWIQGMLQPFRGFARNAFDTFFIADLLIVILLALYFYIYLAQFEITDNSREDAIFHQYQVGFYSAVVGVAYIGFLLIIIWHLALRFPRLMKLLNSFPRRFKKTASIISDRKLVAFVHSEHKPTRSEYGSLNSEGVTSSDHEQSSDEGTAQHYDSDNVVHERKNVITYSQWREPLLASGSLEIETRDDEEA
jgi:predicted outer membrane repeat protein